MCWPEEMSGGCGPDVSCAPCLGAFGWTLGILYGLSIIASLCQAANALNPAEKLQEERNHLQNTECIPSSSALKIITQ